MATAKRTKPHDHSNLITAADVLAGAAIPMRVTLDVTIRPGSGQEPIDAHLARHVPQILRWAKRSPDNARLLLVDPVAAIAQSGVKLSAAEQLALHQHAGTQAAREVLPAGVELVGLDVKVATQKRGGRRG